MRPRQGRRRKAGEGTQPGPRPITSSEQRWARIPALRAHLPACCSPPTASLVLLNQQSQDFGLSQGHSSVHTEVVGAATVLSAQVPTGREVQGQWGGAAVPASHPGSWNSTVHPRTPATGQGPLERSGRPCCRLGPAAWKVPPDYKTQTLMQIPNSQDEGPERDNRYQVP